MTRTTSRRVAPGPKPRRPATVVPLSEHSATHAAVCASRRDPSTMSPAERRTELGAILAAGYGRQQENLRNGLACGDQSERACEPEAVNSPESPKEGSA